MKNKYPRWLEESVGQLKYALPCCPNCETWDDKNELCERANQRPPAKVIAFGCPAYEQDVPF